MTDNGLAALAEALEHEGDACSYDAATDSLRCPGSEAHIGLARRLLRNGAVFLPEGLAEEWDWRQEHDALMGLIESGGATIAALRVAPLDVRMVVQAINAVAKRHGVAKDPPERPLMHIFGYTSATPDMDAEIAAEYAALVAAKEKE